MCASHSTTVTISLGESVQVFDLRLTYSSFLYVGDSLEVWIRGSYPWSDVLLWGSRLRLGDTKVQTNPDDSLDFFEVTVSSLSESSVTLRVLRDGVAFPIFSNVAVSRRYGNRLYLSGFLDEIVSSDEICVYYRRPGDTGIRNLKSDTSDYLYFKGTSGNYDLGADGRYIEFERSGYHWLKAWDVSGNCESLLLERASWLMNITLPRFQYQVIFNLDDPDLIGNLWRLEAEYSKFDAAGSWFVNHEDPDCFTHVQPINTPHDDTRQTVWLNLAVEYGESPCAPIPYYLCPFPTPQTQYWRGECSCAEFRTTLQPLGIPCSHLIAAMKWYAGKPAYSPYVVCP